MPIFITKYAKSKQNQVNLSVCLTNIIIRFDKKNNKNKQKKKHYVDYVCISVSQVHLKGRISTPDFTDTLYLHISRTCLGLLCLYFSNFWGFQEISSSTLTELAEAQEKQVLVYIIILDID